MEMLEVECFWCFHFDENYKYDSRVKHFLDSQKKKPIPIIKHEWLILKTVSREKMKIENSKSNLIDYKWFAEIL